MTFCYQFHCNLPVLSYTTVIPTGFPEACNSTVTHQCKYSSRIKTTFCGKRGVVAADETQISRSQEVGQIPSAPNKWGEGRKLKLAFTIVYYVPNSHHRTSCTVYSSSVLLTPLPFSDYEDKRKHVHERYGKGAVQISNSNKHLAHSAHNQLSRQALVLLFPPGTANCALPKGTFYIHRHDPRI